MTELKMFEHTSANVDLNDNTFKDLSKAMFRLMSKMLEIEQKIDSIHSVVEELQPGKTNIRWLTVAELSEYHPTHPSIQTINSWTSNNSIPFHKEGGRTLFRIDEIDNWLREEQLNTEAHVEQKG